MQRKGFPTWASYISAAPLVFLMLLLPMACRGNNPDSVRKDSLRLRWILSLDSRSTIIERKHIRINGALTGIGFGKRNHKVTVGYYWLNYGSKERLIDLHKKLSHSINLAYYTKTDVGFVSFAYWYPIYNDKRWVVSAPLEVGLGRESARYREISGDIYIGTKNFYFGPCQLGLYGEYKVTPWVGLDLQSGYRDAIDHRPFRRHFKGVYYSFGLTFYPNRIYRDVRAYLNKNRDD